MNKTLLGLAVVVALGVTGCGGGGEDAAVTGSNPSNPPALPHPVPTPPQDTTLDSAKLIQDIRLVDAATEFTAQTFGLESWNPKAMLVHQDVLYVANDGGQASILRYDLKSKRALTAIHAQNISGIGQPWNRLYGLSVHNDRLYAASYSSNRVDVFDIGSGEPQFVTSLGTGAWSGDQHNFALVHPMSVAANDQYVLQPIHRAVLMFGNTVTSLRVII